MIVISATPTSDKDNQNIITISYAISPNDKSAYKELLKNKNISDCSFVNTTIEVKGGPASSDVQQAILDFYKLSKSEGCIGNAF